MTSALHAPLPLDGLLQRVGRRLAHFDGRGWRRFGSPPPLNSSAVWLGSAAAAPRTVWVVGTRQTADTLEPEVAVQY